MAVSGQVIYCPTCGTDHHAGERQAETAIDRELEIARVNAQRDVDVERIRAKVERDTVAIAAETDVETTAIEAEAGVEAAEAVADVLEDVITPPEPEPAAPVVVEAPQAEADVTDDEVTAPPAKEDHKSSGYGNSSWFGGR